jgi:C-terminal processing protease CtpA/Prc
MLRKLVSVGVATWSTSTYATGCPLLQRLPPTIRLLTVGNGFVLRFPAAGWYTWRGNVVEGQGVSPDVEVTLAIEDLRHGRP